MKPKLLLLLCLLLIAAGTKAQPYQSVFGVENTEWRVQIDFASGTGGYGGVNEVIRTSVDTLYKGVLYKKVVLQSHYPNQLFHYEGHLMREDVQTGRVWYRMWNYNNCGEYDTVEKLAWDMTLQVGDTFDLSGVYGYGIDIEQSIVDSVYYDTLNRKHIRLAQRQHLQSFKAEFIEGVGSNAGPFYKRQSCYIYNFFLLCSYKDGMPSYINSYYKQKPNPCDPLGQLAVGIIGDKNQLHPYPNPVNDFLQIDVPNYSKSTITITDITGRVMETFISNDKIKLNTRNYPAGCYIVLLKNDSGSFVAKFMKE